MLALSLRQAWPYLPGASSLLDFLADIGRESVRLFRVACLGVVTAAVALTAANARIPDYVDRAYYLLSGEQPAHSQGRLLLGDYAFADPLPGRRVNSPFGLRQMPWEDHGRLHAGVDIAAPFGEPVQAIAGGVVSRTGEDAAYGRYVELRHPKSGLVSFYAHLDRTIDALQAGDNVGLGQVIGFVGSSGQSTGSHLHLEIRKGKTPLDPTRFLGRSFQAAAELPVQAAAAYSSVVRSGAQPGRAAPTSPAPASRATPGKPAPAPAPDGVPTFAASLRTLVGI